MNVAFVGYRDWALRIGSNLKLHLMDTKMHILTNVNDADIVFYCGWSEMIPRGVYEKKLCLILHPSSLPKYRGGSPLQHQIMAGEKKSAVTICRVTDKLDAGDIYSQTSLSLEGSLNDIFERIIDIGTKDIIEVLNKIGHGFTPKKQKGKVTYFKRRKPEESEIKNFKNKTARQLYNFIRALNDPYPNAFIRCKDGKKLYITGSHL